MRAPPALTTSTRWQRRTSLAAAVATVGVEGLFAWRFGRSITLVPFACFGAWAVVVATCDLRVRRLPDVLVLPAYPIGIGLLALASDFQHSWGPFERALLAMVLVAAALLVVAVVLNGQLGLGDVKLGALIALFAGWVSWSAVWLAVFAGFIIAACWGLPMAVRDRSMRYRFAFGPFLLAGALVAIVVR